ncbi:GATA transcription factor 4-like [Canna indica]|uniref:GATA transcription factor 4-like n=1 Tax=Canna indica TaxID=4628 RepID=A0AAQ3KF89_9LILI|nr:GATA transcription factor 4-like [Canna indica]
MAHEWEMAMAMDFEMGMGACYSASAAAVAAPCTATATASPAYLYGSLPPAADLRVDELLDFSNLELLPSAATDTHLYNSTTATEPSSVNGSGVLSGETSDFQSQQTSPFDLYIPQCEDAAELEWLSKFVEDSDVPYHAGMGVIAPSCQAQHRVEQSANGRGARSKRSRAPTGAVSAAAAAAAAWSSLLPPPAQNSPSSSSSSSSSDFPSSMPKDCVGKCGSRGKKGAVSGAAGSAGAEGGVRRCTHCASEKTPQWRTGPLGPKTLCNACGVRYKSGRLVPEYRPAASPTFLLTQHSNSHRKVMELRRQKEMVLVRHQENDASAAARPELLLGGDYGVC